MDNYEWADAYKKFGKYTVTVEIEGSTGYSRADVNKANGDQVNLETADNHLDFDISPALYLKMTDWAYANGW